MTLSGSLTVEETPDDIVLTFDPTRGSESWEKADVLELLASHGFELEDDARLNAALESFESAVLPESAGVAPPRDAVYEIIVSEDAMSAALTVRRHRGGGTPLSLAELGKAISSRHLASLQRERIRADILAWYKSSKPELIEYELATGTPPEMGKDGSVRWRVTLRVGPDAQALREQVESWGSSLASTEELAMTESSELAEVSTNMPICFIEPPEPGSAGADVYGNPVNPPAGTTVGVELLENVAMVEQELRATVDGIVEVQDVRGAFYIRVWPSREREIDVAISEDALSAYLTLAPVEGATIKRDDVIEMIDAAGVIHGLDRMAIDTSIERSRRGEPVERVLIASGQSPEESAAQRLVFKVTQATGQPFTIRDDGSVDHRRQDRITQIEAGQVICELTPQSDSATGLTVTGVELAASKEKPVDVQAGDNVRRVEQEDGLVQFVAEVAGELLVKGALLEVVEEHHVVGDVGLKSGNVRFQGTVRIRGDVTSGYSVISASSIYVGGTAHGALLSAGEDVVINGGVTGAGRAIVRAKKRMHVAFAEQARLFAVGDLNVKNSILRCQVKCNASVVLESPKGNLVGGKAYARDGVEVANLGSARGVKTEVSFGQNYLIGDRVEAEERQLADLQQRSAELTAELNRIERHGGSRRDLQILGRKKVNILKAIERKSFRILTLKEMLEKHFPSKIVVRGTLYPGVVIESHGRYFDVKTPREKIVITFNEKLGKIEQSDLEDGAGGTRPSQRQQATASA